MEYFSPDSSTTATASISAASHEYLRLSQVSCQRDHRVLFEGLNCVINQGEIVQVTGYNGSGKTTLLRAIMGLMPDYKGDILWQGQPIDHVRYEFNQHLLFVGHLAGIKKSLTPRENLHFLSSLQGLADVSLIDYALEQVGLYGYEDTLVHQLSAGQQRRVALARLYISKAQLWILDEPYTALDVQAIAKLESLFISHAQQGGSILLTSHQSPSISALRELSLADYSGTKITGMNGGTDE